MTEHAFDDETVARWHEVADRARTEWNTWRSVSDRSSAEANAAVLELKMLLARSVGMVVAEWSVTHWLLTWEPIEDCVRAELAEVRPWPSAASKLRGQLASPSQGRRPVTAW